MAKAIDKTFLFEQMPVKKAVLKQILPSVISQMIVLIYSLADTYFVGLLIRYNKLRKLKEAKK